MKKNVPESTLLMIFGLFDAQKKEYLYFYETLKTARSVAATLVMHVADLEIRRLEFGQPFKNAACVEKVSCSVNAGNIFTFAVLYNQLNEEQKNFLREIKNNPRCTYANTSLVPGPWNEVFRLLAEKPLFTENAVSFTKICIPDFV